MKKHKSLIFMGFMTSLLLDLNLRLDITQAQSPISGSGCYTVRSLNNNFRSSSVFLSGITLNLGTASSSEGASVQMVQTKDILGLVKNDSKVWKITQTDTGFLLTTRIDRGIVNLDGASDGKTVDLNRAKNVTHGQYWQLEQDGDGVRIRSLNNNFRDGNYRWLDGASDGRTVKLVNGKSHGTLWEIKSTGRCPSFL